MIYSTTYDFKKSCVNFDDKELKIYAHPNELLHKHSNKTWNVFKELMDDSILNSFYSFFKENNYLNLSENEFLDVIKKFVYYHDIGKISFSFQLNKLTEEKPELRKKRYSQLKTLYGKSTKEILNKMVSEHSFSGYYIFNNYLLENYDLGNNLLLLFLSFSILGHHTEIKKISENKSLNEEKKKKLITSFILNNFIFKKEVNRDLKNINDINEYIDKLNELIKENKYTNDMFSSFYKYIYSVLISADALASAQCNEKEIDMNSINNRIDSELLNRMKNRYNSLDINQNINDRIYTNIKDINDLRHNMLIESSENLIKSIKNDPSQHIFYLNMPTGAGKTNTSMKLALNLLEYTNANRVIYAMPFINIIDQNYDIIKNHWNLEINKEIRDICSTSSFVNKDKNDLPEIIIKDDFFDYPIMCTTFVRLFDIILNDKKNSNYAFSSLSNSVIILDEVQSLPLKNWTSLTYILNSISKNYNIYFILMSATLPQFDKLLLNNISDNDKINCELLIKEPSIYFNHKYFSNRNRIVGSIKEFSLSKEEDKVKLINYYSEIIEENFNNEQNHGLIVLNTVKSSKIVYDIIKELSYSLNFKVDLLNSTVIKTKKRKLIDKINNLDLNEKYILISTQSIEAGVDASFDFVIRDFATLDSIEQVRGRCNRGNEGKIGNVYLTNLKLKNKSTYEYIYSQDELKTRVTTTKNLFKNKTNLNYEFKDIDNYYNTISNKINTKESQKDNNDEFSDFKNIERWNTANYKKFKEENGIHIIDKKKEISFYIEEKASIDYFSDDEIKFLEEKNLIKNNMVDSIEILEDYIKEIENIKKNEFMKSRIIRKQYGSIMNNFIINTYKDCNLIKEYENSESYNKNCKYFNVIYSDLIGDETYKMYSLNSGLNKNFKYDADKLTKRFI